MWRGEGGALPRGPGLPGGEVIARTVTVVIPTKDEAANIEWVLAGLPSFVDEVIVVDGHSSDGTAEAARRAWPDVLIVDEVPLGKGAALRSGFQRATSDIVMMIDGDGSMSPAELRPLVDRILDGCDFVKGSRYLPGGDSEDITRLRSLGNRVFVSVVNWALGTAFSDLCYGLCAFERRALPALSLTADGFEIETQMVVHAVKAGLVVDEVPSVELTRRTGKSHLHPFRDGLRILWVLVTELRRPRAEPRPAAPARAARRAYAVGAWRGGAGP